MPFDLLVIGILLIAGAVGLAYYVLRGNAAFRPANAFQWVTVTLASLVVGFAALLITMALVVGEADNNGGIPLELAEVRPNELNRAIEDFSFRLVTTDAESDFSDLRGKVVLVNIWATWCAPCRFELPELNRLQADYRDAGLVVLNLSDETRENLLTYQNELPLETMSAYVDVPDVPEPFRRNFQVRPTSFVVDRSGLLRESALGMRSYEQFLTMVEPYLHQGAGEDV